MVPSPHYIISNHHSIAVMAYRKPTTVAVFNLAGMSPIVASGCSPTLTVRILNIRRRWCRRLCSSCQREFSAHLWVSKNTCHVALTSQDLPWKLNERKPPHGARCFAIREAASGTVEAASGFNLTYCASCTKAAVSLHHSHHALEWPLVLPCKLTQYASVNSSGKPLHSIKV